MDALQAIRQADYKAKLTGNPYAVCRSREGLQVIKHVPSRVREMVIYEVCRPPQK